MSKLKNKFKADTKGLIMDVLSVLPGMGSYMNAMSPSQVANLARSNEDRYPEETYVQLIKQSAVRALLNLDAMVCGPISRNLDSHLDDKYGSNPTYINHIVNKESDPSDQSGNYDLKK